MTTMSTLTDVSAVNSSELLPVVTGALESLEQVDQLLRSITQAQYVHICAPYLQSSMGSHVRHILDMFYAFKLGLEQKTVIDYDLRRRGSPIEVSLDDALGDICETISWLQHTFNCAENMDLKLANPVKVKTEVCLLRTVSVHVDSNVGRELIFVASHAVHHFAILATIGKLQGVQLDDSFGVAPATRTFLREELNQ